MLVGMEIRAIAGRSVPVLVLGWLGQAFYGQFASLLNFLSSVRYSFHWQTRFCSVLITLSCSLALLVSDRNLTIFPSRTSRGDYE